MASADQLKALLKSHLEGDHGPIQTTGRWLGVPARAWRAPVSGTHRVARVWVGGPDEAIRSDV